MIKRLVLSILTTAVVSTAIAFGLSTILGFWQTFSLAFILQVISFYYFNNRLITKQQVELEKILNDRYEILSKNLVQFACPCGQQTFEELIYINAENTFKCEKCDNNITVGVNLIPAIATIPMDIGSTLQKMRMLDEENEYNTSI